MFCCSCTLFVVVFSKWSDSKTKIPAAIYLQDFSQVPRPELFRPNIDHFPMPYICAPYRWGKIKHMTTIYNWFRVFALKTLHALFPMFLRECECTNAPTNCDLKHRESTDIPKGKKHWKFTSKIEYTRQAEEYQIHKTNIRIVGGEQKRHWNIVDGTQIINMIIILVYHHLRKVKLWSSHSTLHTPHTYTHLHVPYYSSRFLRATFVWPTKFFSSAWIWLIKWMIMFVDCLMYFCAKQLAYEIGTAWIWLTRVYQLVFVVYMFIFFGLDWNRDDCICCVPCLCLFWLC